MAKRTVVAGRSGRAFLGVCERSFRRYLNRYEETGRDGLLDKRLTQASQRRAPVDEVLAVTTLYSGRYQGWNVKPFYAWYCREHTGRRSYNCARQTLQKQGKVTRASQRGAHRKRRERSALPGMMIHQDGSTHKWIKGQKWDLIVTMDDATNGNGWLTPEAGGKVDKVNLTQFRRALKQLDIEMIAAYSPQARGRSERMFGTHQGASYRKS